MRIEMPGLARAEPGTVGTDTHTATEATNEMGTEASTATGIEP